MELTVSFTRNQNVYGYVKQNINEILADLDLSNKEKSLLVAAGLVALSDCVFTSYMKLEYQPLTLAINIMDRVGKSMERAGFCEVEVSEVIEEMKFLMKKKELSGELFLHETSTKPLLELIIALDEGIKPHLKFLYNLSEIETFYLSFLEELGIRNVAGISLNHIGELCPQVANFFKNIGSKKDSIEQQDRNSLEKNIIAWN